MIYFTAFQTILKILLTDFYVLFKLFLNQFSVQKEIIFKNNISSSRELS